MGSCMSSQKQKNGNVENFKRDQNLLQKTQIYQPLFTTLFNSLRKFTDVIFIFSDTSKAKQFSAVSLQDIKTLAPKAIKMTYSFKKLVIVGQYPRIQKQIVQINKKASVTAIYVITQKIFQKFCNQYMIYKTSSRIANIPPSKIPLLVFNSDQLIHPPSKLINIFIHLIDHRDNKIYSQLRVDNNGIIDPPSNQNEDQQIAYYLSKLKNCKSDRIIILHKKSIKQNSLMQIISNYIMFLYDTKQLSTKTYIAKSLPNAVIVNHQQIVSHANNMASSKVFNVNRSSVQLQSNVTAFHKFFKESSFQIGKQKTQRAYNLLAKLLSNITSNPTNQDYKKVKGANKQMEQLLTRNRSGINLLKQAGFSQKDGYWLNKLQIKYLKVLRTDMDLGYRNYITQSSKQLAQ